MGRKTPYKFFRGNGSTFKKNHEKASKYFYEIQRMLQENEYLKFEKLNYFSKCVYLWYLNDNKVNMTKQSIENYCINNAIFSWMDTKENRGPDSQLILIVNDLDKRIPDSLEKATQSYDISMIQWTERNSKKNLDLLAS